MEQTQSARDEFKKSPTHTIAETAAYMRLGINQTYAAAREGAIPSLRLGGRILVPTARLLAMLGESE